MRDFRNLRVWQEAHHFTVSVYKLTREFPREELFGLTSQLRRAATSIGANIAEGAGRNSLKEFARFLDIAAGSASECEYLLILATDLGYKQSDNHEATVSGIKAGLNTLRTKVLS